MNKTYWEKYYKSHSIPDEPSLFARFVLKNYLNDNESLIELGCGNGRDSIFFARHCINVVAIDQCAVELSNLEKLGLPKNLKFVCNNFVELGDGKEVDNVYSRFTLHSISEKEEDLVINWVRKNIKKGGKLFIEVRGKANELYGLGKPVCGEKDAYVHDNHYRRFIDLDNLSKKLRDNDFTIISAEEKSGFAPFKNTNYKFIRIIALK